MPLPEEDEARDARVGISGKNMPTSDAGTLFSEHLILSILNESSERTRSIIKYLLDFFYVYNIYYLNIILIVI